MLVARGLGPRSFGYYALALALFPLVLVVGSGIDSIVLRDVARERADDLGGALVGAVRLRLLVGGIGLAVGAAAATGFVPLGRPYAALVLIGVALLCDQLTSLLLGFFIVLARPRLYAVGTSVNSLLTLTLASIAVTAGGGLVPVAAAYVAGSAVALAFAATLVLRRVDVRTRRSTDVRLLARRSAPLGAAAAMSTGALRLDTVMLAGFSGTVAVALYNVAYRFFESTLFISWALAKASLPAMARATAVADRVRMFELLTLALLSTYLPLVIVAPFAGEWILTAVFSNQYAAAARVLPLMAVSGALYALAHLSRTSAISIGVHRSIASVAAGTFAFNLVVNLIVIPIYGFVGAAWTTLATEIVEAAGFTFLFVRGTGMPRPNVVVAPVAAAGVAMGVLAVAGARNAAALVLAAVAYPPLLFVACRLVARSETATLLRLVDAFRRRVVHA